MARIVKNRARRKMRQLQQALNTAANYGVAKSSSLPSGSPASSRATRQKKRADSQNISGNNTFYAFVMTTPHGEFRFPFFKDRGSDSVYTSWGMTQRFTHINDDMLDIWKRVAVDQAIDFDDNVDFASIRLVRFRVELEDVTHELFDEKSDFDHHQKLSVVGRLTDHESKLLGLGKERAIYKVSANNDQHPNDRKLLKRLSEFGEEIDSNSPINMLRR